MTKISSEENLDDEGGKLSPKKIRKKSPRKETQVSEALEKTMQGGKLEKKKLRFHDPIHKYLHKNLTGRGGKFDSPFVRKKMTELMNSYHPSVFHSYMRSRVHQLPSVDHYDPGQVLQKQTRVDPRPTVVDMGGSLSALTHSENGFLQSYDAGFYHFAELV